MTLSISAVAACCSRILFSSRVSRATSVSLPEVEEWRAAVRVFALWLRPLASLLLARERRRIAHPKAWDHADFQSAITAGICGISLHSNPRPRAAMLARRVRVSPAAPAAFDTRYFLNFYCPGRRPLDRSLCRYRSRYTAPYRPKRAVEAMAASAGYNPDR